MVVRKVDIAYSQHRVTRAVTGDDWQKRITPSALNKAIAKAKADPTLGAQGAKVLKLAYEAAKADLGRAPSKTELNGPLAKVIRSLTNDRAKGRINDGYVDKREAGLQKSDLAKELYKLVDSGKLGNNSAPTPAKELAVKAPLTKVAAAVKKLEAIIDKGFAAYAQSGDPIYEGPAPKLVAAAKAAGLSAAGRAAMMTAFNGATSRSDGSGFPSAAGVKQVLRNVSFRQTCVTRPAIAC